VKNLIMFMTLTAVLYSTVALALICKPKEYSEYKDEAVTAEGRQSMLDEYCFADGISQLNTKLLKVSIDMSEKQEMLSELSSCEAVKSKIHNALTAAKAFKTLDSIKKECKSTSDNK